MSTLGAPRRPLRRTCAAIACASALLLGATWVADATAASIIIHEDEETVRAGEATGASGSSLGTPPASRPSQARNGGATPAAISTVYGPTVNVSLSQAGGLQTYPASISDGAGGMIVVWHDARDAATTDLDIYAQHILSCGIVDPAWPADGLPISRRPLPDIFPAIATDGAGGAFIAWTANAVFANSPLTDVYVHHVLAGGVVDPAWPVGGLAVGAAPGVTRFPKITSDGATGVYVAWEDFRSLPRRVYVQHVLSSGADPLPAWTPNGVQVCPIVATQALPNVCPDGAGGVIVAWNDQRAGLYDIYAQRLDASASLLWPVTGAPVCTATGSQRLFGSAGTNASFWALTNSDDQSNCLVPDGSGGCLVAWTDRRSVLTTGDDAYAQRLTSSGVVAAGWPANGIALCTDIGNQDAVSLQPDGLGGAIAVWNDTRPDIFVQHFTGAGVVDGPLDGLGIIGPGAAPGLGYLPVAGPDGSGGANVSWSDARDAFTNGLDIYLQHVSSSPLAADAAWPAGGVAITTAPGDQYEFSAIVADGAGGSWVAWEDRRNAALTDSDIYAQRVLASGALAPPNSGVTGTVTADCPAPGSGLLGVVVDAFAVGTGELSATTVTGANGAFTLQGLAPGPYTITVMTPLGFSTAIPEIAVGTCGGVADFSLHCLTPNSSPRTIGFWKHQVGVATGGKGSAQIGASALCGYLDLIAAHFNSNALNEVIIYQPPASGLCPDKLQVAKQLLNLTGSVEMISRARQQLLALLLNVAAGYLSQTLVISADGATVSQAITYCDHLIDNPASNHELAKTIADLINNGQLVPAGRIPLSTETIAYARGGRQSNFRATPNPARGPLRFLFSTASRGPVNLTVYDLAGRTVAKLVDEQLAGGSHAISWSGLQSARGAAKTGVYFARLRTPEGEATLRVLQLQP